MQNPTQNVTCPHCGADQARMESTCWLCGQELSLDGAGLSAGARAVPGTAEKLSFSLNTTMLLMTLASVVLGVIAIAPGMGILVAIISLPVLVRTIGKVRESEAEGQEVGTAEKVGLFLGSFAAATITAAAVCAATFCAFCGVCLLMISGAGAASGSEPLVICLVMFLVAFLMIWIAVRIIRRNSKK